MAVPGSLTTMNDPVPGIGVAELGTALRFGGILIDVREPHEYVEAHVGGARLVPLQNVPDVVTELPADQPVYVICLSGGRSHNAASFLRSQGIDAINVLGGTAAWVRTGLPYLSGSEPGVFPMSDLDDA
jgi:rhodanese-related sulfurtransferase